MDSTSFCDVQSSFKANFEYLNEQGYIFYQVDTPKDKLWKTYIESYGEEIRQEYNCNTCKSFIKTYGGIIGIHQDTLEIKSLWDIEIASPFNQVFHNMNKLVLEGEVKNVLYTGNIEVIGEKVSHPIPWEHFYLKVPSRYLKGNLKSTNPNSYIDSNKLLTRALEELSISATNIILDLISNGCIYRGNEYINLLNSFLSLQEKYKKLSKKEKELLVWLEVVKGNTALYAIRNTAIGTLLIDLSNDVDIEVAVRKFEKVMGNYKNPLPIFSQKMLDATEKTIEELGYSLSLARRFATETDVSINDVLFIDRNTSLEKEGIFGELSKDVNVKPFKDGVLEEVDIYRFLTEVVPESKSIELLVEDRHKSRLVSLIAPVNKDSKVITKWGNNFTWSYKDCLADGLLKEKVKTAGGKVDGEIRCSLEWYNYDDLDIHLRLPNKEEIFYGNRKSRYMDAHLDVDKNVSPSTRKPVENIILSNKNRIFEGSYTLSVNNFCKRESVDVGFYVEIECQDKCYKFHFTHPLGNKEKVVVARFSYNKNTGVTLEYSGVPPSYSDKEYWGLKVNRFYKVSMIMNSPNYWESGNQLGNKHVFFMLQGCKNNEVAKGLFNEFIKDELVINHKRVLQAISNKILVQPSPNELSGIGFCDTIRNSFVVRVTSKKDVKSTLKVVI